MVVELKSTSSPATVTSVTPPVKENKESVAPASETVAGERETMNASEEKTPVELTPPVVETMAAVEPPAATEVDSSARFDNFSKVVKSIQPASPVAETVATVETSVPIVTESIVPTAAVSMPIESSIIEEVAATVNSTAIITPVVKLTDYQNNRALKPSALAASIRSAIASPAIIDSPVNRFFSPATIAVSESSRTKIWPITAVSEGLVTITEENTQGHNYSASINETVTVPPNNLDTPTEIEVVATAPSFSTLELSPADQEEIITAITEALIAVTSAGMSPENLSEEKSAPVALSDEEQTEIVETVTGAVMAATSGNLAGIKSTPVALSDEEKTEIVETVVEAVMAATSANLAETKSATVALSDEEQTEIIETVVEAVMVATATNLAEAKLVPVALSAAAKDEIIETVVAAVVTTAETKEETIENKPEEKVVSHNLLKFLKNYWITK